MFSFFSRGRQWASSFANEGRRKARPLRLGSAARDAPECPEFGALSHDALRICSALEIIILYKRKKCNSFSQYCCGLWGETDFSCKISIKGRNLSAKSLAEFAPAGANKVKIIFSGGVYVGENTSRPASVEFLCRRRRNYARSRVQAPQTRAQRSGSRLKRVKNSFLTRILRSHRGRRRQRLG